MLGVTGSQFRFKSPAKDSEAKVPCLLEVPSMRRSISEGICQGRKKKEEKLKLSEFDNR